MKFRNKLFTEESHSLYSGTLFFTHVKIKWCARMITRKIPDILYSMEISGCAFSKQKDKKIESGLV